MHPKSSPHSRCRYMPSSSSIWCCKWLFIKWNLRRMNFHCLVACSRMFAQSRRPRPVLLLHGLQDRGSGAPSQLPGINGGAHPQWVRAGTQAGWSLNENSWNESVCFVIGAEMRWTRGPRENSTLKSTENCPLTCLSLKRFVTRKDKIGSSVCSWS